MLRCPQPEGDRLPGLAYPATPTTVTFADADGSTVLTLLVQAPSRQVRDAILGSGMEVGLQEQLELLERLAISLR